MLQRKRPKHFFVTEPKIGKQISPARKDDEIPLLPARHRAEIEKIPSFLQPINIHTGRIGAFVVQIFVLEPRFRQKRQLPADDLFIRLFVHTALPEKGFRKYNPFAQKSQTVIYYPPRAQYNRSNTDVSPRTSSCPPCRSAR